MGGLALAPHGAERKERVDYEQLKEEVLAHLKAQFPGYHGFVEIPSYSAKMSFGDLDIIYTNGYHGMKHDLIQAFPGPHFNNDNALSILYKGLQVDLIYMEPENYHTSLTYYSYNDLGNLIGKLYHKFGLKYGHRGLTLVLREEHDACHKFGEVVISKNMDKIFEFIGLDYGEYLQGFHHLENIFQFVISSRYFDPAVFAYENMNATARVRDKKRATYTAFLKYIEDHVSTTGFQWKESKAEYLSQIFEFFPEAWAGYKAEYDKFEDYKKIKAKFNGTLVKEWLKEAYPLRRIKEGKEFGDFIKYFKDCFTNFDGHVENSLASELKGQAVFCYNIWVNRVDYEPRTVQAQPNEV